MEQVKNPMAVEAKKNKTTRDFEIKEVAETPFVVVYAKNKYHICCAGCKVSQKAFKTHKAAVEYINSKPWELIYNGLIAFKRVIDKVETQKEQNNEK